MKNFPIILLALILLSACNRPVKLLNKGHTQKALKVSLKRLKNGKVKPDNLYVLEKSFLLETEKDAQLVSSLRQKGKPALWLDIHKIATKMVKRQSKVTTIQNRLNNKGHYPRMEFYPAEILLDEAEENVAIYYYAKAQEYIPAAENNDRLAARQAFKWLQKVQEYKPRFRDSKSLADEMYAIGTTHVLLNPIDGTNFYVDRLFTEFFECQRFPERKKWEVFHINPPANEEVDYRVDMNWDRIYVSWDDVDKSSCSNTVSVQDGYENIKVWSDRDSAFVTEKRPVYIDVSVTVNSYYQNKYAQVNLYCEVINLETQQQVNSFAIRQQENWDNEYSEVCGDRRALNLSCNDIGGCRASFPSDWALLRNASRDLNRRFNYIVDREIN